ncbi:Fur family transcriptional regulator [Cellulomonas sp. ATA003]|uniref:Fur family transcriptional regulator n=1 Tax=Cellulomonas sp. ATA003 TaxID=3073064 RepID=UPI002873EE02|nr:Fur family transcriptional regulator [Cellulomonas sp. ATA003]WNB84590.1 Fur family transcriptional regulator [Cellulomonas sp. ATA003]
MARMTRQRAAVAEALDGSDDFRSAQQLHEQLRAAGDGVGLATVYRTLQQLAEGGEVDVLRTAEGESVYRRCIRREHHHHLVCRLCGRTVEIDGPTVEEWAARVGAAQGYADIEHTVELFGTCGPCQRGESPDVPASSAAGSSAGPADRAVPTPSSGGGTTDGG